MKYVIMHGNKNIPRYTPLKKSKLTSYRTYYQISSEKNSEDEDIIIIIDPPFDCNCDRCNHIPSSNDIFDQHIFVK